VNYSTSQKANAKTKSSKKGKRQHKFNLTPPAVS
jgi:hypothetical protein